MFNDNNKFLPVVQPDNPCRQVGLRRPGPSRKHGRRNLDDQDKWSTCRWAKFFCKPGMKPPFFLDFSFAEKACFEQLKPLMKTEQQPRWLQGFLRKLLWLCNNTSLIWYWVNSIKCIFHIVTA